MNSITRLSAIALTLGAALSTAQALPTVYFGENQSPNQTVTGAPLTARNAFVSNLVGIGTETFEGQPTGATAPLPITFTDSNGSITATLNGSGQVFATPSTAGRFNTTGATAGPVAGKWWLVAGAFDITFSAPISAFGFYGTDIGDFNGQVTVALTDLAKNVSTLTVPNTLNGNSGSLLFWGLIDANTTYTKISFANTGSGTDQFGFDDMILGNRPQVGPPGNLPEPGSLALVGLSLLALAAARSRSRSLSRGRG